MSRFWKSLLKHSLQGPTSALHRFREKKLSDGPQTAMALGPEFTLGNTLSSQREAYTLYSKCGSEKKKQIHKLSNPLGMALIPAKPQGDFAYPPESSLT